MIINNKKGYNVSLFGFFFVMQIIAVLFLFTTFVVHYLLYDYGITEVTNVAATQLNATGQAMTNINALGNSFLGLTGYFDIFFAVFIISTFIISTYSAIKTREAGYWSFFGFVTIGNIFLIFLLNYAVQIQGWLLNEIIFEVLLVNITTPVITLFFNYSIYIGVLWYLWLLGINQINFAGLKETVNKIFTRRKEKLTSTEGRFEE